MPFEFETHFVPPDSEWAQMDGLREGRGADSQAICVVFAVSFGTRPVHSAKMQSSARPSAGLRFRFRPTPHAQSPPNYKLHSISKRKPSQPASQPVNRALGHQSKVQSIDWRQNVKCRRPDEQWMQNCSAFSAIDNGIDATETLLFYFYCRFF